MRAQEVLIENNKKRYILLEQEGLPVMPIMKSQLHIVNENSVNSQKATYKVCYRNHILYVTHHMLPLLFTHYNQDPSVFLPI